MVHAFFYGLILALGLIIPLGAQNIFLFNQGANQKYIRHALPSVITAFVCDTILILSAVLGVSVAVLAIPMFKRIMFVAGFFFLSYMGFVTWFSRPKQLYQGKAPLSAKKQMLFTASVSLLNPHALLDTIGVIGTSSLQFIGLEKLVFTAACLVVSSCWFLGLAVSGHYLRKIDPQGSFLNILNKLSAVIIWCVAVYIARLAIIEFYTYK